MKRLFSVFTAVCILTLGIHSAWAEETTQHVFDNADIFTEAEEEALEERIAQFQLDTKADAVVLTEEDGSVTDPELRAQDFYDENGFGLGENRSGVILYINMTTRDIAACASGETKYVLLRTDLDTVIDAGYDELSSGEYAGSMQAMLGKATSVIKRHEDSGEYEDGRYTGAHTAPDDQPLGGYPVFFLVTSAVGGVACAMLIYILVARRYGSPVRDAVNNIPGKTTKDLTVPQEIFVNKSDSVRHIPKDPPKSSGSSGFRTSSSGRSFSSSSWKF